MRKILIFTSIFASLLVSKMYSVTSYYAVLVGIEDYPSGWNDLNYCIDDITDVKNMLIQVGNWATPNMWILTNSAATESNILSKINTMKSYEDADDVCIFMFSGHGDNSPEGLVPYDTGNRITPSDLNSWFSGFDTNKILIILDACYSGRFDDQINKGVVLMACQSDESSWEYSSLQNGVFSYYVAEGIEGYADLSGSSISAEETFSYADPRVNSYTGDIQDPEDDDNYSGSLEAIVKTFTLSGSLSHDEIWSGTINITGNVTVGNSRKLRMLTATNVNFSGSSYITVQPGGSIIANTVVTFNPSDRSVRYSGTMSSDNTWGFPVLATDNLALNSGKILTIHPGTTVRFNSGKKLTINGALSAQGTSSNRITFQPSSGTWYGIELSYCYMTTIKYCTIQNASTGIRAYHTALNVDNCTFTSNSTGIKYDNQSSGYVKYSTISSATSSGIECAQNSNPTIRSYNRIWSNCATGVYGDYNSLPELGTLSYYGNNSIKNNYPDEVWSDNSNSLYAQKNYWGSSSPNPYVSDNVIWEPYLTSDPTGGGLLKPFTDDLATNDPFTHTVNDTIGKNEFDKAYQVYLSGDYAAAINLFDQLVNKYSEKHTGLQSLALIDYCYQNLDNVAASSNYLNQVAATFAGKEISGLARSIAVGHLVNSGDYDVAIGYSQQILTEFGDKVIAKYALYDLGTIYWYFKQDYATGEKYYRQLIEAYPDDDLSLSALATLGEWKPIEPNPQPPLVTAQAEIKEFSLDQNYPNPFNPETTIRYHLTEASPVTIKIYNLLGEEVIILVDKSLLQGNHAIQWNGRDRFGNVAANGVYWVRMQAGKFVAQRKLILLR